MNIDDMNQGEMVEGMQHDVKRSDTKSDLLVENHFVVTGQKDEIEGKHSGRKEPDQKSNLSEDNNMNSDDMNQGDMVGEVCSVGIIQGKVIQGKHTRIEKPDRVYNPLVDILAIDKIENFKHTQEEINMRSFLKVIDAERSATESDCSNKILTMDTEQMVERLHNGKEGTKGASNPSADVHPSDTAE